MMARNKLLVIFGYKGVRNTIDFERKFLIFPVVMVARALASTHFVKQSTTTTMNVHPSFPVGSGPTRLTPHCAKGHTVDTRLNSSGFFGH
jgi:hypothetical protein